MLPRDRMRGAASGERGDVRAAGRLAQEMAGPSRRGGGDGAPAAVPRWVWPRNGQGLLRVGPDDPHGGPCDLGPPGGGPRARARRRRDRLAPPEGSPRPPSREGEATQCPPPAVLRFLPNGPRQAGPSHRFEEFQAGVPGRRVDRPPRPRRWVGGGGGGGWWGK